MFGFLTSRTAFGRTKNMLNVAIAAQNADSFRAAMHTDVLRYYKDFFVGRADLTNNSPQAQKYSDLLIDSIKQMPNDQFTLAASAANAYEMDRLPLTGRLLDIFMWPHIITSPTPTNTDNAHAFIESLAQCGRLIGRLDQRQSQLCDLFNQTVKPFMPQDVVDAATTVFAYTTHKTPFTLHVAGIAEAAIISMPAPENVREAFVRNELLEDYLDSLDQLPGRPNVERKQANLMALRIMS